MEEERPIKFHLLHKDELEYEARIRGAEPAGKVTELRAQVRKLSKELPSDEIAEVDLDIVSECAVIKEKLAYLDNLILGAARPGCSLKSLNRVEAVAHHLFHRLSRLNPTTGSNVTVEQLDNMREHLDHILHKLDNILYNFRSGLSQRQPSIPPPLVEEPTGAESITPPSSPIKEIKLNDSSSAIHKLNISFNGTTCVKAFLQRLDELCRSRNISEYRLFNSAAELFTDEALCWYRGNHTEVNNWLELKNLLLEEYLPTDYDHRLMQEIRSRTQGSEESIVNYLSIMQNYFTRLSKPLAEEDKLNIVLFNIRPYYTSQLALNPADSWSDLKRKCRLIEMAKDRAHNFADPPKASSSSLAPDLCYKYHNRPSPRVAAVQSSGGDFCVRCRVKGHSLRSCTAPFAVVCYRCGEKEVTARNCPKCRQTGGGAAAKPAAVPKNGQA